MTAKPLFERAIAITEKALGPEHPDLATWLNNFARAAASPSAFLSGAIERRITALLRPQGDLVSC